MGGGSLGAAAAISARRFTHEHVMTGWGQVVQSTLQHNIPSVTDPSDSRIPSIDCPLLIQIVAWRCLALVSWPTFETDH